MGGFYCSNEWLYDDDVSDVISFLEVSHWRHDYPSWVGFIALTSSYMGGVVVAFLCGRVLPTRR
jgi:hypothetical protein